MNYINHSGFHPRHALYLLNKLRAGSLEAATHYRRLRQQYIHDVKDLAEDGKIALVEDGMDCDCVQYTGIVHIVQATKEAIEAEVDRIHDRAEGPITVRLERPSIAAHIQRTSRDLVMEAHEDGHDHVVYPH